jgi:hypothetical protein
MRNMLELSDESLLAWMTSAAYHDFLECQSTLDLASDAVTGVAMTDVGNLDAAVIDAYADWSRAVDALRLPHPVDARMRWQRYVDASTAALVLSGLARIGDAEPYECDLPTVRGSLGLRGMLIVNRPKKLAEFMADPWPRLAHELVEANAPLAALRAVHAGRASRAPDPDGTWWAWYALHEPAARAAGNTAAAAWHIARSHQLLL